MLKYFFIIVSLNCFCQEKKIRDIISNDLDLLDRAFNSTIFIKQCDFPCQYHYDIIDIDTTKFYLNESNRDNIKSVKLLKILLKISEPFNIQQRENYIKINIDTLSYFILNESNDYYKLFGFYVTDINLFYNKNGLEGMNVLKQILIKEKILTKSESKAFFKSVINRNSTYSIFLNKSCNILKYYFEDNEKYMSNTIILPLKPLLPLYVN